MQAKGQLLRVLGLAFGLAAVVGSVVGQGILRSPGVVAQATADPLIIVGLWIAGALITMLSAVAYAELGAAIPRAGGGFAFVNRAMGEKIGVFVGLALVIELVTVLAMLCFVVGEFLFRLGVGAGEIGPGTLGMAALALFALINTSGTRTSGVVQIALASLKGVVLLGLVIALFGGPQVAAPAQPPEFLRSGWLALGTAIMLIMNTFAGWQNVVFYGEEFRDPGRQMPRALFGGILLTGLIYLLVNLAMLHVMTPDRMAGSVFVAADAVGIVFGDAADTMLTAFGVLSVGAIANFMLLTGTRSVFALGRARVLPEAFSAVDRRGTPFSALVLVAIAAGLLILTGSYVALASMAITISQLLIVLVTASTIILRRREPELTRPFKAPAYPFSVVLALAINSTLLVVFVAQGPWYAMSGIGLLIALWTVAMLSMSLRGTSVHMPERLEELP